MKFYLIYLFSITISAALSSPVIASMDKISVHPSVIKARELLGQRNRTEAIAELLTALKMEKKLAYKQAIEKELKQAQEIFFTDKGLQSYESAEAKRIEQETSALSLYKEAQKLEGDNTLILLGLVYTYLQTNACAKAEETITLITNETTLNEMHRLLQLYLRSCKDALSLSTEDLNIARQLKEYKIFGISTYLKSLCQVPIPDQCFVTAKELMNLDKDYASGYYYAWLALKDTGTEGVDYAQKYLTICNNLTYGVKRKYQWDFELCKNKVEPEKYLKSLEKSG
jgi:hypothetical protein